MDEEQMTVRRRARLIFLASVAPLMLAALAALPGAATASTASCKAWTGVPPPSPGAIVNTLGGVSALSPCNVWAVGLYQDVNDGPILSLAEHWNGNAWNVVPTPNPDPNGSVLEAVSGTSSRRIWAVGVAGGASFILRWDGATWTQVTSPNAGTDTNDLSGVTAVSGTDAWAVGQFSNGAGARALILHWDGQHWALKAAHAPGTSSELGAVTAISSRNVWAVGSYSTSNATRILIEHWNGTKWARVPSPNPPNAVGDDILLSGVAGTSASNVWAVGSYTTATTDKTLIEHWNGRAWKLVASPNPGAPGARNILLSVTAASANNALAVGTSITRARQKTLLMRWNGRAWNQIPSPSPGQASELAGITGTSASDVWAVGFTGSQVLATHCC
jgi:hypothetical protein